MDDPAKRLVELLEPGTTLMVGTLMPDGVLRFRPLTVARSRADRIEILIDARAEWSCELANDSPAWVTMSDNRTNTWVSLTGAVTLSDEPALVDELWSPFAGAYLDDGRQTPGITVLSIECESGIYWSSPSGRLGTLVSMVRAAVGDSNDAGQHGDVQL